LLKKFFLNELDRKQALIDQFSIIVAEVTGN